jgi:hypothetical protein
MNLSDFAFHELVVQAKQNQQQEMLGSLNP